LTSWYYFKGLAVGASGQITKPFSEIIEVQAASELPPIGGYGSNRSAISDTVTLLALTSPILRLSGRKSMAHDEGETYSTLLQAPVEGLNVMDMVTADRVVARLVTDYQDSRSRAMDQADRHAFRESEASWYSCQSAHRSRRGRPVSQIQGSLAADSNLTPLIPTDSVSTGYYEVVLEGLTDGQ
jgi:hypothetical protein